MTGEAKKMRVRFTVQGKPVCKSQRHGRSGRRYKDRETRKYEEHVGWSALGVEYPEDWPASDGRFALRVAVYFPDRKPRDLSNLVKSIEDGCNRVVWRDDSQVDVLGAVRKLDRENPRVDVEVWRIPEEEAG